MSSARQSKLKFGEKFSLKIEAAKPRNPLVMLAATRKAGSHVKHGKALRAADKSKLRQELQTF